MAYRDGTSLRWVADHEAAVRECEATEFPTWVQVLNVAVLDAFTETDQTKLRSKLVKTHTLVERWIEDIDNPAKKADLANDPGEFWAAYLWGRRGDEAETS